MEQRGWKELAVESCHAMLLREWMSSREVSGEWRQAGVTLVFEKVSLTSILGSATERLGQGLITEEPEEGGRTSAGQRGFVV